MTLLAGIVLLFAAALCLWLGAKQLKDTKAKNAACSEPAAARLLR